jgi:sec-independent protein translocase protein TatA
MPIRFGAPELIIVLVIVILIFGVGRLSQIGKELGSAIREFRKNVTPDEKPSDKADDDKDQSKPA